MKQLNEYLSTQIKIYNGFPKTPIYDDMVKFLEKMNLKI